MMNVTLQALAGEELTARLPELGRLRITVFAAFPYLYDGDPAYEVDYLQEFAAEPGSVLVAAMHGNEVVGAATASPMAGQKLEFRQPFAERGYDVDYLFYFGESVLLPEYREQGIGHGFFDHREAAARAAGATHATFAAVIRAEDHPLRPEGYRPLDTFWRKRGYTPVEGLQAELAWKEHGEEAETPKRMQYWIRALD